MFTLTTLLIAMRSTPQDPALKSTLIEILISRRSETSYSFKNLKFEDESTLLPEDIKNIFNALHEVKIISVDFSHNRIDDKGAMAIAEALQVNLSLQDLNLSYNCICAEGGIAIAQALKINTALRSLNLHRNYIAFKSELLLISNNEVDIAMFTNEAAISFIEAMCVNRTLENLVLSNNQMDVSIYIPIIRVALIENSTITRLVLGDARNKVVFDTMEQFYALAAFIRSVESRLITSPLLQIFKVSADNNRISKILADAFEYHKNNIKQKSMLAPKNVNESKEPPAILFALSLSHSSSFSSTATPIKKQESKPETKSTCCSLM